MKPILFLAIMFAFCSTSFSQSKAELQVAKAAEQFRLALVSGKQADLEKCISNKLSYGHSGGLVEDKAAFLEKLTSGRSDFVTIDITEQTIFIQHKTAIVRHILNATTNDAGKPGTVSLKIMLVFVKQYGRWVLLARQAVKH